MKRFALFVSAVLLLTANAVFAQLAVIKGWEVDDKLAEKQNTVFAKSGGGVSDADVDAFFGKYYFARWTKPGNEGDVQKYANDFLSKDLAAVTGNVRDTLLNKSFAALGKIVADNAAPPAARYNAVQTIGQLYQREAPNRGDKPVPYSPVLAYLAGLYDKKDNPEYIRLGALLGIVRHCYIGVADETMKNTALPTLFIALLDEGKPAEQGKRSKEEQEKLDWFRYYGIAGLGALGTANDKTVAALTAVIENVQETLELRTAAAKVFGDLDWKSAMDGGAKFDVQHIGTVLISLMKSASDTEIQTVTRLRDKARASGSGGGGMSSAMSMPAMDIGSSMGGSPGGTEAAYSQLSAERQLEIQGAVQSIKNNVQNVVYAMTATTSPAGKAKAGILPLVPEKDAAAAKMEKTVKAAKNLFQLLDEGPPEDKKNRSGSAMMGGSEMLDPVGGSGGGVGGRTGTAKKDEKQLKVNFAVILEALNTFGAELDGVITGRGT
ncbi:MAG: hypothetical protein LBN39_10625 [Planctomycetaceae bacterium]|jgi:hypothetical protein|nr:hypothetical protein [Planctomycetaceae bacterium]